MAANDNLVYLSRTEIEIERRQCVEEGRDISSLSKEFDRVLLLDLDDSEIQTEVEALMDKTTQLPSVAKYNFEEPSNFVGILSARPEPVVLPLLKLSREALGDRILGALTGGCVGRILGKQVQGWKRTKMLGYLNDTGRFPLSDYLGFDSVAPEIRAKYDLTQEWGRSLERRESKSQEDHSHYTTEGSAIFKKYGKSFTSTNIAQFRLDSKPYFKNCPAEQASRRNIIDNILPPDSASFRNPYREWNGAQRHACFWGLISPGNPELAAQYAFRDASITHVKNGIYGSMWMAAMIAAAFVTNEIPTIIRGGLDQVPQTSRLTDVIESVLEWHELEIDYGTVVYRIHEIWHEDRAHDLNHSISNAAIVATGLLWGEGDFGKSICSAVEACFDAEFNGGATGSIIGAIMGCKALPARWVNSLHSTSTEFETVNLEELARMTIDLIDF